MTAAPAPAPRIASRLPADPGASAQVGARMWPSGAPASPAVVGRQDERRALRQVLHELRCERSAALVVHGEPGVGKTTLLECLRSEATGCRVVSASAARWETELAFAGLHQLCAPLLDRLVRLPAPQRSALEAAFGLTEAPRADRLFLGLAVLNLISEVAADRPLLWLVDDAHWLDGASAAVLAFVTRRLGDRPAALVLATPDPTGWLATLPGLRVGSLAHGEARRLLGAAVRCPLDERIAERLIAEASGNPLALLQAVRGLAPASLAGGFGDPDAAIRTGPAAKRFSPPLAALGDETRLLLLVAAAEPLGDPLLLWRAAERLGIPAEAADAAQNAGLLAIGRRVRFCHPLMRCAVYGSAAPAELRTVHAALAAATDRDVDPERRAWHRGHAASAPDEEVAAELETTASEAAACGGLPAGASFLLKAAVLSPDPADRARRALSAADAERRAGDPDGALRTLASAEAGRLDRLGHAQAALLRARVACASGAEDAARRLLDACRRLEPLDGACAREACLEALGAAIRFGGGGDCEPVEVAGIAAGALPATTPRPTDLLLDAVVHELVDGGSPAGATLSAVTAFASDERTTAGVAGQWLAANLARRLWRHDLQRAVAERQLRCAGQEGVLSLLPEGLTQMIEVHLVNGELAAADAMMAQLEATTAGAHGERVATVATLIGAYRGNEQEGRRLIAAARAGRSRASRGVEALGVDHADLLLSNALGRYEEGLAVGRRLIADEEPLEWAPWMLPEIVEAAARAGAPREADSALRRLARSASVSGTDWARGAAARSRALLCEGDEAEQLYREAVARLSGPGTRVDLARAHLLYGEWLRRAGRRVDGRRQLRMAHDMLSDMRVDAFAERARRELRATGETARRRVLETRDDLTPQEAHIAALAREGLSNPEIGARLFISPRTVEWHLRKIFVKLDIRSRIALPDALPEQVAGQTVRCGLPTAARRAVADAT